jgi:hypothetical protein
MLLALIGCRGSAPSPGASTTNVATPAPPPAARSTIEGVVRDHEGELLPGAVVVAIPHTGRGKAAATDEAGRYEIRDLPAGDYRVIVYSTVAVESRTGVRLDDAARVEVNMTLEHRRSMTITITGIRCRDLPRLARVPMHIHCYTSDVDRAVREVDQSPHQLRDGGRQPGPRPAR